MTALDLGAARRGGPPPDISVNGAVIPRSAIVREVQYHPATTQQASWRAAAEALVVRELLLQKARRLAIAVVARTDEQGRRETEEEAAIRGLIEAEVTVPSPSEVELRRYYDANRAKFRSPDLVEARHILVAARASDEAAYAAARDKARALADLLAAAPQSFGDVARTHSDCASSGEGGRLGQIAPGETTPEFESALAALGEGETTREPVETRYGFHLIRCDRRIPGTLLSFDAVAARLADYLTERARRTAIAQYVALLVSRAEIRGIDIAGAETRRVH